MTLYLRLAWRNIWRHRRRTVIIVAAMGFSLSLMMVYDGLIDGFNQAIYGNAIRVLGGNIQIHAAGYRAKIESNPLLALEDDSAAVKAALAQPNVISATRRIQTGGLVTNREGAFSLTIIGIEPEAESKVSLVAANIAEGRWLASDDTDVILIGRGLADTMSVTIGDRITVVGSDIHKQNRQRTMTIIGIYDLGMASIEKTTMYMSLGEAQALYGLSGKSTEIQVNLEELGQEPGVVNALVPLLPRYEVESWEKNYPELQTTISRKGSVMNVFGVIIIMIAGIGILNLLLMAIYERTREIGLLGAMGLKPRQIAALFILEGTLIGVVGAVAGALLGVTFNFIFGQIGFDYSSYADLTEYMALISGRIYPTLGLANLPARMITVIVISTLAAWIPAQEASRREPAEALHYV
ncbi:MAG: FtsX-like permease family protein [Anaerolineales bacterium]|nr:FtsX-like permease family protein [Anaerolineales bacterium]